MNTTYNQRHRRRRAALIAVAVVAVAGSLALAVTVAVDRNEGRLQAQREALVEVIAHDVITTTEAPVVDGNEGVLEGVFFDSMRAHFGSDAPQSLLRGMGSDMCDVLDIVDWDVDLAVEIISAQMADRPGMAYDMGYTAGVVADLHAVDPSFCEQIR